MVIYRLSDGLTKEQRLRKNKIRGRINERQSAETPQILYNILYLLYKVKFGNLSKPI